MWKKRMAVGFIVVLALLVCSQIAFAQEKAPTAKNRNPEPPPQKVNLRDPRELVLLIKNASIEDLKNFSFLELNLLKNAVFASSGYRFAQDRPWLNEVFCGARKANPVKKKKDLKYPAVKKDEERAPETSPNSGSTDQFWHLDYYSFPECKAGPPLDEDQKRAIANIRVALFRKIKTLGSISAVDAALDKSLSAHQIYGQQVYVLGKTISASAMRQFGSVSMRRDLHGINRMLQIMNNMEDFDSMELLGLFMGDVIFLRNAIEAKYGKTFIGVQGWEISQLIGVSEKKASYDPQKLPPQIQNNLKVLEEIAEKIQRSDLNDVPASFRNRPIEFNDPYELDAC